MRAGLKERSQSAYAIPAPNPILSLSKSVFQSVKTRFKPVDSAIGHVRPLFARVG
jgi:hypothetical protein